MDVKEVPSESKRKCLREDGLGQSLLRVQHLFTRQSTKMNHLRKLPVVKLRKGISLDRYSRNYERKKNELKKIILLEIPERCE